MRRVQPGDELLPLPAQRVLTPFLTEVAAASGLPDGLRQIPEWNPVSAVVAALRTLFGNPVARPSAPAVAA